MLTRAPFLALATLLTATLSFAGLSAPNSLYGLASRSNLIVSAQISAIKVSDTTTQFTLNVTRVIKGDPSLAGTALSVQWDLPAASPSGAINSAMPPNPNGVWFLNQMASGWSLASLWQGDVPLYWTFIPQPAGALPAAYAYEPNAATADKVAAEVCFGLENASDPGIEFEEIEFALLDPLNSPYAHTLYERLSTSTSIPKQIRGFAGLIRGGDANALSHAFASASSYSNERVENGFLLASISENFRSADAASITTLGTAATSPNTDPLYRLASAHALSRIRNAAVLPYLAALLDDTNDDLRIEAISGFSAYTDGPDRTAETTAHFAMGPQAISRDEAGYIAFWKSWWAQQHPR